MTDWTKEEYLSTARWLEVEAQKHHAKAFQQKPTLGVAGYMRDTEYDVDEDFAGMQLDKAAAMIRQLLGEP